MEEVAEEAETGAGRTSVGDDDSAGAPVSLGPSARSDNVIHQLPCFASWLLLHVPPFVMYLMYYLNEKGDRVYTMAKVDPNGRPTFSAHPGQYLLACHVCRRSS